MEMDGMGEGMTFSEDMMDMAGGMPDMGRGVPRWQSDGAQVEDIPDTEEFFELSAKDARTGKTISMERFDGMVTIITNVARTCDAGKASKQYDELEHLHSTYPYTLEIVVFPFDHPGYPVDSCIDEVRAHETKAGRKIHVMEPAELNGANVHPVYGYLRNLFDITDFPMNHAYHFMVHPDGNSIGLDFNFNFLKNPEFWRSLDLWTLRLLVGRISGLR